MRLGVGRPLSAVRAWINKRLCACVMRTGKHNLPLVIGKYSVLLQMEMEARCLLYKCDIYTFSKVEFLIMSTDSASSKGQKNWVRYTQARYNLLFSFTFWTTSKTVLKQLFSHLLSHHFWSKLLQSSHSCQMERNKLSSFKKYFVYLKVDSSFSFPASSIVT